MQPASTFAPESRVAAAPGPAPKPDSTRRPAVPVIRAYPIGVVLLSIGVNALAGIGAYVPTLPGMDLLAALAVTGALLLVNHTWLMTVTEEVRHHFQIPTTPEQWKERGLGPGQLSHAGVLELQRHHGAHRNATENTTLFVLVATTFMLGAPDPLLAQLWIVCFGVARLGHTYGYLRGRDGVRGLFMTLSLLSLYGMGSHALLSVWSAAPG